MSLDQRSIRGLAGRWSAGRACLASWIGAAAGIAILAGSSPADPQPNQAAEPVSRQHSQVPVELNKILRVQINLSTGELTQSEIEVPGWAPGAVAVPDGRVFPEGENSVAGDGALPCDETVTHTDANFQGGSFIVQAGFAQNEAAGASYTLTPGEFPILFRSAEMIFATSLTTVTTTTEWSLLIYEGNPNTGTLIQTYSSDGVILPHLVIPPGTNGVNIVVIVDPQDPDQIVIQNPGNATYSVAFRIDKHNNQTQNPCFFAPPTNSNAFPTTDTSGLAQPTRNWLLAVNCGQFGCPAGWTNFQSLPFFCRPSGDWVMRSTYTAFDCNVTPGACCSFGACEQLTAQQCASQGGQFLGVGTPCSACNIGACCLPTGGCAEFGPDDCVLIAGVFQGPLTQCDTPGICTPGACCLPDGTCVVGLTAGGCAAQNGSFQGPGSSCTGVNCPDPIVPCCFPGSGGCLDIGFQLCLSINGIPGQFGQSCATFICFPIGACCLPDGGCVNGVSPADCATLNGVFQGDGTSCTTTNCPLPTGACCFATGACILFSQQQCGIAGGAWQGPGTSCVDANGNGIADDCEDPTVKPCLGDLNGDGVIDADDLGILLGDFGCNGVCPGDLNSDGAVDADDLGILLGVFGGSC